jgi:hypothetical protein
MENSIATQKECDLTYNNWLMAVISAICRMTKLPPARAHDLFNKCQFIETLSELYQQLENVDIMKNSSAAQQFVNYWLYSDSDERS